MRLYGLYLERSLKGKAEGLEAMARPLRGPPHRARRLLPIQISSPAFLSFPRPEQLFSARSQVEVESRGVLCSQEDAEAARVETCRSPGSVEVRVLTLLLYKVSRGSVKCT